MIGFRVIGLTGGIATGKSTTSRYLRQLGIPVIDFDVIAREVVQKGSSTLKTIQDEFGPDIILPDGNLDRVKLGEIIFNDPSKRKKLNDIMQQPIFRRGLMLLIQFFIIGLTSSFIRNPSPAYHGIMTDKLYPGLLQFLNGSRIIVLDCPLLFESGLSNICSHVLYIDTDVDVQIQRLMQRDHISEDAARQRMNAQYGRDKKLLLSDAVISNNSTKEHLYNEITQWWVATAKSFGLSLVRPKPYSKVKHIMDPDLPSPPSPSSPQSNNTHYVPRTTQSNLLTDDVIDTSTAPSWWDYYSPMNWCFIPNITSLITSVMISVPAYFIISIAEPLVFGSSSSPTSAAAASGAGTTPASSILSLGKKKI